jgi:hypothetical protein
LDQSDEKVGLDGDAVGAVSEGCNARVLFLHLIDAPREEKA